MAFRIVDDCVSCGACELRCPNQAISLGDVIYVIDPLRCTECAGSFKFQQCADVCPVSACVPDPERPEGKEALLAKWRGLHPGEEPEAGTY